MEVARLVLRQEAESEATPVCAGSNDYDGRMGVRISSIFVIFVGSLWGKSISSPAITSGVWCSYITAISFGIWRSHPYNSLNFVCHMIFFSLYIYIYLYINILQVPSSLPSPNAPGPSWSQHGHSS